MQAIAAGTAIAVPILRLARGFPLPLLMIGAGLALSSKTVRERAAEAVAPAADKAREMMGDAMERAQSLQGDVREAVSSAGSQATSVANKAQDAAAGVADDIGSRAAQAAGTVTDKLRTGIDAASGTVSDTMNSVSATVTDAARVAPERARQMIGDNAALIGGLGIAIGAIIAASLPATRAEASVLGDASDGVKRAAGEAAESGFEAAKDAVVSVADAAAKSVADSDLGGHASRIAENMNRYGQGRRERRCEDRVQSLPKPEYLKEAAMSDLDLKKTNLSQKKNTGSSQKLKDQVADAGADLKQRAGDALKASTDVAQDKLQEATDAAKDMASGAADHLQDQVKEQQRSGADFVERFAGNIRDAARAFESDAPFAARGINSAAEYVEDAAEKIRNGSFRDLVDGATDFAKRQPAAFLGISVLAGFAAIRFLKASGGQPSSSQQSNNWNQASSSYRGNKS